MASAQILPRRLLTPVKIDSLIKASLLAIMPFLFFICIVITGTMLISYTFFLHLPLPQPFTLAIVIAFSVLILFTAFLLVMFHNRSSKDRRREAVRDERSVEEIESERPGQQVRGLINGNSNYQANLSSQGSSPMTSNDRSNHTKISGSGANSNPEPNHGFRIKQEGPLRFEADATSSESRATPMVPDHDGQVSLSPALGNTTLEDPSPANNHPLRGASIRPIRTMRPQADINSATRSHPENSKAQCASTQPQLSGQIPRHVSALLRQEGRDARPAQLLIPSLSPAEQAAQRAIDSPKFHLPPGPSPLPSEGRLSAAVAELEDTSNTPEDGA